MPAYLLCTLLYKYETKRHFQWKSIVQASVLMATNDEEGECRSYEHISQNDENQSRIYGNKENITLIWFDKRIQINSPDIQLTKVKFREINDYTILFTDMNECTQYIESIKTEKVLLIVSGVDAHDLLSKVHNLRQIDSVFIFCMNKAKYESILMENEDYSKIVGIFSEQSDLIKNIEHHIHLVGKQMDIFSLYTQNQKAARNLTKESASFIWHQLLKSILQKMPSGEHSAKREMLDKCRLYYRGNKKELRNIEKFDKTYSKREAIKWYTKDSFIFKLINKALRTEDVEALYTFRFYLIDLCSQLEDNHRLVLEFYDTLLLYRGAKHTEVEIQRLKDSIGHLILTNGFLSTSKSVRVAEIYAGIEENFDRNEFESIIYEINYKTSENPETILGDISGESEFSEEEYLFDLGTVFQVENVIFDEKRRCWICQMSPSNKGSEIAKEYVEFQRNEMNNKKTNIFVLFGNLLYDMGEYIKSRNYFQNLLSQSSIFDSSSLIDIYQGLAHALIGTTQFDLSQKYLQDAYDLCVTIEPFSGKCAQILGYMGYINVCQGKFDIALDFYFKGLQTIELNAQNRKHIFYLFNKIGLAYYSKGQDDLSLEYLNKSFEYLENLVPEDHPDTGEYYNNMCMVHYHKGSYDLALFYQRKAYESSQRLYPADNHMYLSVDLNNIGKCYYKKCEYKQAIECFEKSLHIARRVLQESDNYMDMGISISNIGKCFYRQKNYSEALKQYEITFALLTKDNLHDHIDMAYTLKNIGEVYLDLLNFDLALSYFKRALFLYEKAFHGGQHRDIAKCLNLIGQVYYYENTDNDDETCLNYYNKALSIWQNVLPNTHPDLALCYKNITLFYLNRKSDTIQAEKYFQIAYMISMFTLTNDHPFVIEMCNIKQIIVKYQKKTSIKMQIDTSKLILFLLIYTVGFCFFL
ncbi:unnamed protein product [Adineta ricciae]|uniref:Uncharacterized protein n=1 Tax=Adineta ricciae TaxID=249248 RepID=A0A813UAG1_ADIRI|nr:unnamed protein product [Adineta ricciae]CAF1149121.1 unnamed protein product [Adineta ricciae]